MWQRLSKRYRFKLLLGVTTDTYDSFGLISRCDPDAVKDFPSKVQPILDEALASVGGEIDQAYPPFSSMTAINASGFRQALWKWSREGRLHEIQSVPTKRVVVHTLNWTDTSHITGAELLDRCKADCLSLSDPSNFRVTEILDSWKSSIKDRHLSAVTFPVLTIVVDVSSGTYVRALCHAIGQKVGCGGIALEIERERVGPFTLKDLMLRQTRRQQAMAGGGEESRQ
eukprot:CAMPEP_0170182830 /NCGR_PEP_ID=MMETSP0040_2-20121228/28924_1 /TAXON_ID=641309 /ORGANISM="Lotharella oceanica, Strain CCMP622" /LENGTH=226 /DNA_ID=CAMNT_0010428383 /DNA_START=105 /DNA_END=785 /DNA_ORIENTATION=-